MLQHLDELKIALQKLSLTPEDVIIVGSAALTVIGGRKNNDIEFSLLKSGRKKIPLLMKVKLLLVDHIDLSDNVDLFSNRYLCLGVYDKVFERKELWNKNVVSGFHIVTPEYEYAYKLFMKRKKDIEDINSYKNNDQIKSRLDYSLINALTTKKISFFDSKYRYLRKFIGINLVRFRSLTQRVRSHH